MTTLLTNNVPASHGNRGCACKANNPSSKHSFVNDALRQIPANVTRLSFCIKRMHEANNPLSGHSFSERCASPEYCRTQCAIASARLSMF